MHTDDGDALRKAIGEHPGDADLAHDLAPELAKADGERFDAKTGELLQGRKDGVVQESVAALRRSLSAIATGNNSQQALARPDTPERKLELDRGHGRSEPEIDFRMEI